MNKIVAIIFASIFLFSFVSAENIATIDENGLGFEDSNLMQEFEEIICGEEVLDQDSCPLENVFGKIDKIIPQEVILVIQEVNPEAAKAIELNNQIQRYVQQGTQIWGVLEIDEIGIIRSGTFLAGGEIFEIGNMLNQNLKAEYVRTNGQIDFMTAYTQEKWTPIGKAAIALIKEGGFLEAISFNPCLENNLEGNCVPEKTIFNNLQFEIEGETLLNYFVIDENGKIESAKFWVNENGGEYLLGNQRIYAPSSSSVKYESISNSISISMGVGSKLESFQKKINESLEGAELTIRGSDIELPTGEILAGELGYKNNNFFIKSGTENSIIIDGIKFKSPKEEDLILFFGGDPPGDFSKSYVSFDSKKGIIVLDAKKKGISEIDLNYGLHNSENLIIKKLENSKIILSDRDSQNLVPKLKIIEEEDSNYNVLVGEIGIYNEQGEIKTKIRDNLRVPKSSIGLAIEIEDQEGNSALGTKEFPQKIIINDFNQFLFVPKDLSEEHIINPNFNERLNFDYSGLENIKSDIKEDFGIKITGDVTLYDLKRVRDLLGAATPEMISSVNEIEIISGDDEILGGFASGFANPYNRKVSILNSKLDKAILLHEMAHTQTYQLFQEPKKVYEKEFQDLRSDYLKKEINEEEFRKKINELKQKYSSAKGRFYYYLFPKVKFIKEWENIAGDDYGRGLGEKNSAIPGLKLLNIGLANEWAVNEDDSLLLGGEDINRYGAKNGFVEPYGANDILEDIATFVETVYEKPSFFEDLLNPESEKYDERYLEKLKLLKKYGFIKEDAYNSIMESI